jgi:hypothetical protein
MSDFDYDITNPVAHNADLQLTRIEVMFDGEWGVRPPNPAWLAGMIREKSDGRPKWKPVYTLSVAEGRKFRGTLELNDGDHIFGPEIERQLMTYGERAHIDKLSMLDLDGWSVAPTRIQTAIEKEPEKVFARMLNFGHLITDWTGSTFFKNSSGNQKYANPKRRKLGKWYNMLESQGTTLHARIDAQLKLLHLVRGIDGQYLDLGEQAKRYVWVGSDNYREVEKLLNRMELVPSTNGTETGGGNTSKIWNDAIPVKVPWLRSDALVVATTPPDEQMAPFVRLRGVGRDGVPVPNLDPETIGAGQPEFETVIFDTSSHLYKTERKLGFARLHNRGYGLGSPHCLNISYSGVSTATVGGVDYSTLPADGFY